MGTTADYSKLLCGKLPHTLQCINKGARVQTARKTEAFPQPRSGPV